MAATDYNEVKGVISAQNSNPAGEATANSAVEISIGGYTSVAIQTSGTWAASALSIQYTINGTEWVTLSGNAIYNLATNTLLSTITAALNGVFALTAAPVYKIRVTALGAITGSVTVVLRSAQNPYAMANIGGVTVAGSVSTTLTAGTVTGATLHKAISAASTNATNVKSSGGKVYHIIAINLNAAIRYLKLYNKASAPTVGTDTPVAVIPLPPNVPVVIATAVGMQMSTGISYALTTGIADNDNSAVAANEILVNIQYA